MAKDKEALGRSFNGQAAESYRHLGALAFLDDTEASLAAYRRATELDPENPVGWNQLGHLLGRTGDLVGAEAAYETVLRLGETGTNREWLAAAYGNLGSVYRTRGELDRAVGAWKTSRRLYEEMVTASVISAMPFCKQGLNLGIHFSGVAHEIHHHSGGSKAYYYWIDREIGIPASSGAARIWEELFKG